MSATISSQDLNGAAEEFSKASKETLEIAKRLEHATGLLQKKWEGAAKQVFYSQYKEWHQAAGGFAMLLSNIARELHAMAERYEHVDDKF
jgi:WXG100 family type VII secretion target